MASPLTLVVFLALLGLTAARVMVALRVRSRAAFLLGAFLVAHVELLLLVLALSVFRGVTAASLLIGAATVCGLTLWLARGVRGGVSWRGLARIGELDPLLVSLAVLVALGFAYSVAMGTWVPQVEDDELTHHLVRAQLWWQHHGITYLHGIIDFRNNGYPPGGELGPFATMALAGNDYFVALDQIFAGLALAVGAAGISRRLGFDRRQAVFGGLLVLSLPIIALQVGTAMSDLVIGAFLVVAAFFLIDGNRWSPWLAGAATALAVDVKLSALFAIPLLLAFYWFARPETMRTARLVAVVAGTVLGSYWYVVNLIETGTWDGHASDSFHVDRSVPAMLSRIARLAIEFIEVPGAVGRDRWLYAFGALVVLLAFGSLFVRSRRKATLAAGAVAAVVGLVPLALPTVEHALIRGYFKFWLLAGRRDLANTDPGRDITKSAANFSWYGPLGSALFIAAAVLVIIAVRRRRLDRLAVLCCLAPAYWCVAFGASLYYQDWIGRYFAFPFVLAAATWGIVLRWRPVAWGIVSIAGVALLLALANDAKRPSGLPLLERNKPRSVWDTPRWTGVALRKDYDAPIRFLDQHILESADVGLAITPSEPVYPFFGRRLDRHVRFVHEQDRDAPEGVNWVFVRPDHPSSL
ncbi:MAG: glycosyltransferase 87 family protein, partial [Actinomycetota bacterium]